MREIIKLGLILLIITSAAALVLAVSNDFTSPTIEKVEAQASEEARKEVLPTADKFVAVEEQALVDAINKDEKVLEVFAGTSNDAVVGYAIKTATPGYGGDVQVITGISIDGEITGIKVVNHQETPGLGANATGADFQNQYAGKKVADEVVVVKTAPKNDNEIQALTGATITSKAVTAGINVARELFNNLLNK